MSKYYVVWKGVKPGVYTSWTDCQQQITGVAGALYKSYKTRQEAVAAYRRGPSALQDGKAKKSTVSNTSILPQSWSVDAACSGNPGKMEYRGVETISKKEIFNSKVYEDGTNNIGEFLAIVHALALLEKNNGKWSIYSDSQVAIGWVAKKKANTKLARTNRNGELFEMIERAEKWLKQNSFRVPILKWETKKWGEIPADFGRK